MSRALLVRSALLSPTGLTGLATALVAAGLALSGVSCKEASKDPAPAPATVMVDSTGNSIQATEWVGFHTEVPFNPDDFHALASGLFGEAAQARNFLVNREIAPGTFVDAVEDTSTPDQSVLKFSFDDGTPNRKKLAVAPASYAMGTVFISTADAAIASMKADIANNHTLGGAASYIEYRTSSPNGGRLSFGVKSEATGFTLILDIATPRTSLERDRIGQAADKADPYDTVAGTVWFPITKDDFDYFSDHAYGKGATSKQNFQDFALAPHEWLRLTVNPHLDEKYVNVAFELLGLDGKRTKIANAPASVLAGSTFKALIDRNMANSVNMERTKPGSAPTWKIPFYYDSPKDGGVVQVVAEGRGAKFDVAYAVESPRHTMKDVAFLEYDPVVFPEADPLANATCDKLGDPSIVLADKGTLNMKFQASEIVKKSEKLKTLKAKIYCSIFPAADVTVSGPKRDAVAIQDFQLENADLGAPEAPTFVSQPLHAGSYQVLCFQDDDNNGDANPGDAVTVPVGSYPVACNVNPTTIEFAVLYPEGR